MKEEKLRLNSKKEDEYDKTEGIIVGVDENGIMLEDQNGKSVKVLFDDIKEAKIVPNI